MEKETSSILGWVVVMVGDILSMLCVNFRSLCCSQVIQCTVHHWTPWKETSQMCITTLLNIWCCPVFTIKLTEDCIVLCILLCIQSPPCFLPPRWALLDLTLLFWQIFQSDKNFWFNQRSEKTEADGASEIPSAQDQWPLCQFVHTYLSPSLIGFPLPPSYWSHECVSEEWSWHK